MVWLGRFGAIYLKRHGGRVRYQALNPTKWLQLYFAFTTFAFIIFDHKQPLYIHSTPMRYKRSIWQTLTNSLYNSKQWFWCHSSFVGDRRKTNYAVLYNQRISVWPDDDCVFINRRKPNTCFDGGKQSSLSSLFDTNGCATLSFDILWFSIFKCEFELNFAFWYWTSFYIELCNSFSLLVEAWWDVKSLDLIAMERWCGCHNPIDSRTLKI